MSDQIKQPRRGARFSLLTMVWLFTIAALVVGLYTLARRNSELSAHIDQLAAKTEQYRKEFGIFEVEDSTKINTMDMSPRRDSSSILGKRHYHVYLPPGRAYFLKYQINNIPADGLGDCPNPQTLQPGEYEVKISVAFERDTNQRRTGFAVGAISFRPVDITGASAIRHKLRLSELSADWIINEDSGCMEYITEDIGIVRDKHNDRIAGEREVELHDADQPLVLHRTRAAEVQSRKKYKDGQTYDRYRYRIPGLTDGFMLWIESEPIDGRMR